MISPFSIKRTVITLITLTCIAFFQNAQASIAKNNKNHQEKISSQELIDEQTLALVSEEEKDQEPKTNNSTPQGAPRKIRKIIVSGNTMVPDSVILSRVPYKVGEVFNPSKTKQLIHNLYYDLKRFRTITILGENVPTAQIDLYIQVEEKTPLKEIEFKGNSTLSKKEIEKKIDFSNLPAIDAEELTLFAQKIKKLYLEKNFHNAQITSQLSIDEKDGKGKAIFSVKEGKKSMVKRVRFKGNNNISGKELRSKIFTREDWPLSFLDNSGSYQPDRIEADKHIIEQFYQSRGYMTAKVANVDVKMNEKSKHFDITFEIQEGDLYTVNKVTASGNEILKDEYIVSRLPVQSGDLYSREKIVDSIKALEGLWGELGYIYAHVDPSIQPNEEEKTVNIAFHTELGNKVFLNRINIIGNRKTRDKVIRRKLALSEGQLLTNSRMEMSKDRIESLGYFDQKDGVNWRKTRVDDEHADLDLLLKEIKTGRAHLKIGFGGAGTTLSSPLSGLSVGAEVADTNLFGTGIQLTLNASWAKEEQSILFNITDPWLFDQPILGSLDVYHKRPSYDDFKHTRAVNERLTGAGATLGFITPYLWETQVMCRFGIDRVAYEKKPEARVYDTKDKKDRVLATTEYQGVLDKLFQSGKYFWIAAHLGMDRKNHPIHPSRGYKWLAIGQFGVPSFGCNIGFCKFDCDLNWYTPLIGERDLVLRLHAYFGFLTRFKGRTIPYRELFHIGGPASVRGFLFGQVGPQFLGDSIGGQKGFFVSAELSFPITPDFNMKGVVFYDGGSGWDNPYACGISKKFLEHNTFQFRHSVGVGLRILRPMPVRIDWGFKLDRNKKLNETASEVHFGMTYDF